MLELLIFHESESLVIIVTLMFVFFIEFMMDSVAFFDPPGNDIGSTITMCRFSFMLYTIGSNFSFYEISYRFGGY